MIDTLIIHSFSQFSPLVLQEASEEEKQQILPSLIDFFAQQLFATGDFKSLKKAQEESLKEIEYDKASYRYLLF